MQSAALASGAGNARIAPIARNALDLARRDERDCNCLDDDECHTEGIWLDPIAEQQDHTSDYPQQVERHDPPHCAGRYHLASGSKRNQGWCRVGYIGDSIRRWINAPWFCSHSRLFSQAPPTLS